ncbi:hypothetical protein GUJ93_ZPchr0009g2236 [Zizania palustris]|uniref:B box-type domain-containing protein n=1 Tax=Zizania palustris TaxID=103762 RepID=A0A8J5VND4_ZIZPA|nr:hypothetical protein GUJ93_ZPchr0009g2236 [Zizania palustris]
MKIGCDACGQAEAAVLCCADDAALCRRCDAAVHSANRLAGKHRPRRAPPPLPLPLRRRRPPHLRHLPASVHSNAPVQGLCPLSRPPRLRPPRGPLRPRPPRPPASVACAHGRRAPRPPPQTIFFLAPLLPHHLAATVEALTSMPPPSKVHPVLPPL